MKKFLGAAVVAAALSFGSWMSMAPASAASPVATVEQNAMTDFSAQYYRGHRRHRYYRQRYYAPRYYAPRYYAPRPYYGGGYGYGYRRSPGIYFGF